MKEKTPITPTTPVPAPSVAVAAEANRKGPSTTEQPLPHEPSLLDDPVASGTPLQEKPISGLSVSLGTDADEHEDPAPKREPKMRASGINVFYGEKQALKDVSIDVHEDRVTAFIGPSGCGKSTFLRCRYRVVHAVEAAQERRLAAARWTDERSDAIFVNVDRDILQRLLLAVEDVDAASTHLGLALGRGFFMLVGVRAE